MVHARLIPFVFLIACGTPMPVAGDAGSEAGDASADTSDDADATANNCVNCPACYQNLCAKRLFASSKTYDGAGIQSTLHADDECAAMAKAASLSGKWQAWISDTVGSSPATRFGVPYPGPYVLAKNPTIRVVKTADDFSKKLEHAIDLDENGMLVSGFTWTQTDPFGDAIIPGIITGDACADWTSASSLKMATTGLIGGSWTGVSNTSCDQMGRIYCFEQ